MTTRLLTIISGQPLPNYIAINEIRPDVVHCIYTPQHGGMKKRFEDLKEVVQRNIPDVRFEAHPIDNAYDSKGVWDLTVNLLTQHNNEDDDWMLNRSAGTEQMRGPLVAAFDNFYDDTLRGFFVETDHQPTTHFCTILAFKIILHCTGRLSPSVAHLTIILSNAC